MCGIAGLVQLDCSPVDSGQLDRLTDALAHRGPDGRGTYIHQNVGLGHRRLSIIDLTDAASQPMHSQDGDLTLVFNGEIYNFEEKRRLLEGRGHTFTSTGDTEVLLKLYQEFGGSCLQHLRGMFAFAIHDKKRNHLFLARDRLGKKPIKYFIDRHVFAFASELKALRTLPSCPHQVDPEMIHHYLTMMYVPSPDTGIRGIQKLPAAHSLLLDLSTKAMATQRYWALSYKTDAQKSLNQWKEEILSTLTESVNLRMIADVPVGAFLSGGVDSAAIVALMAKCTDKPVKTFSIGTKTQTHNELPDAERIAKLFGTDHRSIIVQPNIIELLPKLVHNYEEPYADPSSIPTYLIAGETRSSVTVALNGDGGDENFAGYIRYPILRFSEQWRSMPAPLHFLARQGTNILHSLVNNTLSYRMRRFEQTMDLPWEQRYLQYISFFTDEEKRELYAAGFGDGFQRTDEWYAKKTIESRSRAGDLLHRAMSMDIDTYLADDLLPKVDLGSMAHGLEARSPLLDHQLMELTAQLPADYQLHGRKRKWIFKEILKDMLPADHLRRPKTGFRLPLDAWFRTDLSGFVSDRLLAKESKLWDYFDRARMEGFLKRYRASSVDFSDHIWALLWLDEWLRQYG